MQYFFLFASLLLLAMKPYDEVNCWNIVDSTGKVLKTECDKTAAYMEKTYTDGLYYNANEPKFCWQDGDSRAD